MILQLTNQQLQLVKQELAETEKKLSELKKANESSDVSREIVYTIAERDRIKRALKNKSVSVFS